MKKIIFIAKRSANNVVIFVHTKKYKMRQKILRFQINRPHRSFKLTRRRDYAGRSKLPKFLSFTHHVNKTLYNSKRIFLSLAWVYVLAIVLTGGMMNQFIYTEFTDLTQQITEEVIDGELDVMSRSALILSTLAKSGADLTDYQRFLLGFLAVFVWLATVWLLRQIQAGEKPKVRDGLYNSGAPLFSTFLVLVIMALQLMPLLVSLLFYGGLLGVGLIKEGFSMMLASVSLVAIVTMTLYWLVSTFFALIVVTLPGVYPMQAMRVAGDFVSGRRLGFMLRLIWMAFIVLLAWLVIGAPAVALEMWLRPKYEWISYVPIIPLLIVVLTSLSTIWVASYIYLLYRKVIDDDATLA
ncbi:hypothetical protein CR956_01720 [Candidatus Saccharibacteria bacterium]|nr:MAG: hypothetical protein CR956_01720 [Candidatus Saccharibacteria bacterium]